MRCSECPGLKFDGFWHCLLVYPLKPKQLMDDNKEADYCQIHEKWQAFSDEVEKQTESGERFEICD